MAADPVPGSSPADSAPVVREHDAWADLSLFYARTPRADDDGPEVHSRAEVIWGEGRVQETPGTAQMRTDNLGDGLRLLRVSNSYPAIAAALVRESFDYQLGKGKVDRFTFGLVRRPPVRGVTHPKSGTIGTPVGRLNRIDHFVRLDKVSLLQRIAGPGASEQVARQTLSKLLDHLGRVAGRDFRGEGVRWLGDIVIGKPARQVASWKSIPSADRKSCKAFEVRVQPGLTERVHVHVRAVGLDGMCLCDRILEWNSGDEAPRRIDLDEELASVSLRAWADGDLACEEQAACLRGFSTKVQLVGATYSIQDRITEKLESAVRAGAVDTRALDRARRGRSSGMSTRSASQMGSEPWAALGPAEHALFDVIRPRAEEYAYFPRSAEGRANAVIHFTKLISDADHAFLVDPWFDSVGAAELLMRVAGDVRLTIVTNLPFADHVARRERLREALRAVAVTGLPRDLRVLCVPSGGAGNQTFHDRFLVLRKQERWRGFVLTNSFSGWATTYPLFVVETPLATTALLLDELERLLDTTHLHAVWPPPKPAPERRRVRADRGEFPHWRILLRSLVPNSGTNERAWLKVAESRGFLTLTDDGMKWLMGPAAREVMLRRLLDRTAHARFRRPRRVRSPRWPAGARKLGQNQLGRGLGIGRAVLILGELVARGLDLDARTVANRLHPGTALDIERALARSFRDRADPTELSGDTTQDRLMLRQSLRADVEAVSAARFGISAWNDGLWDIGRHSSWDRCFAYAVLAYLAPERAVSLCEKLLDADLLLALVGSLHQRVAEWTDELASALIRSGSPVLRVLGAQSVAHRSFRGPRGQSVSRPSAPASASAELARMGVPQNDRALYATLWGVLGDGADAAGLTAMARLLGHELAGLEGEALAQVVEALFTEEARALPFLRSTVDQLLQAEEDHVTDALDAMVTRFARRFRAFGEKEVHFTGVVEAELTSVMAHAAAELARRRKVACSDVIRPAADLARIQAALVPLTPFRHRNEAAAADVALGWVALWELASAALLRTDARRAWPEETLNLATAYLAAPQLGSSEQVREALSELLCSTRVAS